MGQVVIDRRRTRNGDAPQSGAFGGEGAMFGILEGDGFISRDAKFFDHGAIEIRRGFSGGDVLDAAQVIEGGKQTETREVTFDMGMAGVGGQSDFQSQLPRLPEVVEHAGKNGQFGDDDLLDSSQFALEFRAIYAVAESGPLIEVDAGTSNRLVRELAGKRPAGVAMDELKGVDQGSFSVEDQTIEIKNERANHEASEVAPDKMSREKNQFPAAARSRRR